MKVVKCGGIQRRKPGTKVVILSALMGMISNSRREKYQEEKKMEQ